MKSARLVRILILLSLIAITIIQCNKVKELKQTNKILMEKLSETNTRIDSLKLMNETIKNIKAKIIKVGWSVKDSYATELAIAIDHYSGKYDIDENLLISIACVESSFEKYAKSSVGCLGYFQINPHAHSIDKSIIYTADYNTRLGCQIFLQKMEIFEDNQLLALNSYNGWASKSNPYAKKVLKIKNNLDKKEKT